MRIVALIMAGGRGKRFDGDIEKPMVELLGKPLIKWVIEATKASKSLSKTYVAITSSNSRTGEEAAKMSATIIQTSGLGYHADLREAVSKLNIECPVLTISSDLPLLNGEFLDDIISKYKESGKPALTVLIPVENCRKYGIEPTSFYEHEGSTYAISGINVVDGRRILEEQQQEIIISEKPEAVFNINARKDLESAKNYLLRSKS